MTCLPHLARRGIYLGMLGAALLASACDDDGNDEYAAVSPACDACLSQDDSAGCEAQWQACTKLEACSQAVVCALRAQCYVEPSESSCSSDAGCTLANDTDEAARTAAAEFETCARTQCAATCGFVTP